MRTIEVNPIFGSGQGGFCWAGYFYPVGVLLFGLIFGSSLMIPSSLRSGNLMWRTHNKYGYLEMRAYFWACVRTIVVDPIFGFVQGGFY